MKLLNWGKERKQRSQAGISVPADWRETKEYLARIVSREDGHDSYFGRRSFQLFLEHAFLPSSLGHLTDAERKAFMTAITSSEGGATLNPASFPDIENSVARERFRNWVFNVVRTDKPPPPESDQDLLLTAVAYTHITVFNDLRTIFRHYSPQNGGDKLHNLTDIARHTSLRLGELGRFIPSIATLVANDAVAFEDLMLIPCLMQKFLYTPNLFVLDIQNRPMVLLSKQWWKWGIVSSLSFLEPGVSLRGFADAVEEVKTLASRQGYAVETFFQP